MLDLLCLESRNKRADTGVRAMAKIKPFDASQYLDGPHGAVRNAVGIRLGEFSGNMKLSFQAARSIG